MNMISRAEAILLEKELSPGETVTWAEKPNPWSCANRGLKRMNHGLVGLLFSLFWTFSVIAKHGLTNLMAIFGFLFCLISLGSILTPFWFFLNSLSRTYVITNRRVIIIKGRFFKSMQSFFKDDFRNFKIDSRPDGKGDILFINEATGISFNNLPVVREIGLIGVSNVEKVHDLMNNLLESG